MTLYRRQRSRPPPRKRNAKRQNGSLLLKRLLKAKDAPPMEKLEVVKTHLRHDHPTRDGGIYNRRTFNQVETKPEMICHYLGEFSITYKPMKHGQPGIGATHSSRFIPLVTCWPIKAAAAAKSLQSCPTLCDPIDGSPPGSPIPGILQARILEWVAIAFSNKGRDFS
uniref:40S ribosomal protein S15 n=1 Tax=Moschus moschiferus TaxID=68415 RepID=A0A8C6CKI6_MOSMO